MTPVLRRVVKLGGSLLDWPELVPALRRWIADQPLAETILVLGGGDLADVIRRADALHGLGERPAHWLCVQAMRLNATMLAGLLPEARWPCGLESGPLHPPRAGLALLDPEAFLLQADHAPGLAPLLETWDVTSDSIAARAAVRLHADELVLLKSASAASLVPDADTLPPPELAARLVEAGYVDRYFADAMLGLPQVRYVNLRQHHFAGASVLDRR